MRRKGIGSAAFAAVLALAPAPALAQDVSGDWEVRWAQAIRVNGDGTVEVQGWGDAALTLSQDGALVTGTWTTNVLEEVSWPVSGTLEGDRLTLRATENDSANPELDVVEQLVWEGTVSPDRIEGTVAMSFKGMNRPPGERPFTAVRAP
jgi:hypothetical protein